MSDDEERVVAVLDGEVVTVRGRTRTRYLDVLVAVEVGAVIDRPLPHRARFVQLQWSPFDGDTTDDDADPGAGRRTF